MFESSSTTALDTLNEYCLFDIFSYLELNDQYQVYRVNEYFQHVITRLWCSKYLQEFNFIEEYDHIRLLPDDDAVFDVLSEIAKHTSALLRIPSRFINMLHSNSKESYPNIKKLSAQHTLEDEEHCRIFPIMQLPEMCPNLYCMDLMWFQLKNFDRDIFQRMKSLTMLSLISSLRNFDMQTELIRSVTYCNTLQYLRISVTSLNCECEDIVQMKSLQMLQLYQVPPDNEMMEITLKSLFTAARSANRQIVGLHIKSHLDSLASENLLLEQSKDDELAISNVNLHEEKKKKLLILRRFSWQPIIRLLGDYNHTLAWNVLHPKVKELVTTFIQNSHDLKIIDISKNCHFNDYDIACLQRKKPNLKIYHKISYHISPFPLAQLLFNEETITFEFL